MNHTGSIHKSSNMALMADGLLKYLLIFLMVAYSGDASADQVARYKHLLKKAKTLGSVGVIVGLAMPEYKPEDKLPSAAAIKTQRDGIRHLQNNLLGKLAEYKISNVKKYTTSPFIAMKIGLGGLMILASEPLVKSIEEDAGVGLSH